MSNVPSMGEFLKNSPSNWGKWGADDEKGTANYITPDKVLAALKIPQKGQIVSMTLPYDANGPQTGSFRRINPVLQFLATGADVAAALGESHRVLAPGGRFVAAVWGARRGCGWADIFPIVEQRRADLGHHDERAV